jgi:uncharacterized protein
MLASTGGNMSLHFAARGGHIDVLEYVLNSRVDINTVGTDGTALNSAARYGMANSALKLLQLGIDTSIVSPQQGWNLLFDAVVAGHTHMVKLLIQHGLSIQKRAKMGETLLMIAAQQCELEIAKLLLQAGADVHAVNDFGYCAVQRAALRSNGAAMIRLLLDSGADPNLCTLLDTTPLSAAVEENHVQCAAALLEGGAHIEQPNGSTTDETLLHQTVQSGRVEMLKVLLLHATTGVLDNRRCGNCDCCGTVTALMLADKAATLQLLLAAGADVHRITSIGNTCLHVAATHNYPAPVICLLIKAGVDLQATNRYNQTAAQLAEQHGRTLIAALLNRAARP